MGSLQILPSGQVLVGWGVGCVPSGAQRRGFETIVPLQSEVRYAVVTALDRFGRRLKHSPVIEL